MKKTSSSSSGVSSSKKTSRDSDETQNIQVRHEAQEMRALLQKQKKVPEASVSCRIKTKISAPVVKDLPYSSSNSGLPLTYFCGYYRLRASSQQTGSENFLSLKFIWVEHTKIQCFFLRMDFGGTPNFETSISFVGADFSRVFKKASV